MIKEPHFVIYGNEIESKGVQASFPADVSLIKLIGAANYDLQLPVYSSNFSALVPQYHQIRMRFDERDDCLWLT